MVEKIRGAEALDGPEKGRSGRHHRSEAERSGNRLKNEARAESEHDIDPGAHAVNGRLSEHEEVVRSRSNRDQKARSCKGKPDRKRPLLQLPEKVR